MGEVWMTLNWQRGDGDCPTVNTNQYVWVSCIQLWTENHHLWLNNSVQEGDGTILLVALYCKPYGRINTVDVLKEALFVGFLVDNKGVIHIPATELRGVGSSA